jgi:hypothetical protein
MGKLNNNNWQADFENSIKEIDSIYSDTIEKLEFLHQKKMKIIRDYKNKLDEDNLKKIREEIKEGDKK